jgi:hypothetical protein
VPLQGVAEGNALFARRIDFLHRFFAALDSCRRPPS